MLLTPSPAQSSYSKNYSSSNPVDTKRLFDTGKCEVVTGPQRRKAFYREADLRFKCSGGGGSIFQTALYYADGSSELVAVKQLTNQDMDGFQKMKERLTREAGIWLLLDHPYIAPLVGFRVDAEKPSLLSPWYETGSARDYLKKESSADRVNLLQEIAIGLRYLHERDKPIIHGDLKPDNILIGNDGAAKIIDFGLSRFEPKISDNSVKGLGVPRWQAPELTLEEDKPKTLESDVYSFGCILFWLLAGCDPFHDIIDRNLVMAMYRGATLTGTDRSRFPQVAEGTPWGRLLDRCCDIEPNARARMSEVVQEIERIRNAVAVEASANRVIEDAGAM